MYWLELYEKVESNLLTFLIFFSIAGSDFSWRRRPDLWWPRQWSIFPEQSFKMGRKIIAPTVDVAGSIR